MSERQVEQPEAAGGESLLVADDDPFIARLLEIELRAAGYDVDVENILAACAKYGVAVEINAHPWRLDLDWRWHEKALDYGCILSINPDAHSIRELDHMHWGVEMARKGGVPADRVLNAMALPKLRRYLSQRRRSVGRAA